MAFDHRIDLGRLVDHAHLWRIRPRSARLAYSCHLAEVRKVRTTRQEGHTQVVYCVTSVSWIVEIDETKPCHELDVDNTAVALDYQSEYIALKVTIGMSIQKASTSRSSHLGKLNMSLKDLSPREESLTARGIVYYP